jgi:hypothetical protein
MAQNHRYLDTSSGARIAYRRLDGASPGVVFLGGFMSDMSGRKAHALEEYCAGAGSIHGWKTPSTCWMP